MLTKRSLHDFRYPRLWLGLWFASIGAALLVSLIPMPRIDAPVAHFDKVEHVLGYALLSAFAAMLFARRRALLVAMAGLFALGLAIELVQAFLPWRTGDPFDVLANTIGVLIGAGITATPLASSLLRIERMLFGTTD